MKFPFVYVFRLSFFSFIFKLNLIAERAKWVARRSAFFIACLLREEKVIRFIQFKMTGKSHSKDVLFLMKTKPAPSYLVTKRKQNKKGEGVFCLI